MEKEIKDASITLKSILVSEGFDPESYDNLLKYSIGDLEKVRINELERLKIELLEKDIKENIEQVRFALALSELCRILSENAKRLFTGEYRDKIVEKLNTLKVEYSKRVDDFLYLASDAYSKKEVLQKYGIEKHRNDWLLFFIALLIPIIGKIMSRK